MITINSIIGNVNKNDDLKKKYADMKKKQLCESVTIGRMESERTRMRKTSDRGTDIVLDLPKGNKLRHGDVIMEEKEKIIIVEIEAEDVLMVKVKKNIPMHHAIEIPVRVGHTIGNLHRPLKLDEDKIYFPIQTEDEVNMFKTLFKPIGDHLEITKTKMVFEPDEGVDVHEH